MIRLNAGQLGAQLQKSLHPCYFLFGNDPLMLQESEDSILYQAQKEHFNEHFSITLDARSDWNTVFGLCQTGHLYATRQTLLLVLPDGVIQAVMGEKLLQLAALLHKDLLLILRGISLTRVLEKSPWFKALSSGSVLVSCDTPEQEQLDLWVKRRAKNMKLTLDDAACQVLCYCYEGNLLALSQALELLSLIYPDRSLTLQRVKDAVNNAAHFTPIHWVDAVLAGKSRRAARILRQLRLEAVDPLILLRSIQREVLQLLKLKRQITAAQMRSLFDRDKVSQNRQLLLTQVLARIALPQLREALALIIKIELALKQNYGDPVWSDLNALTLLLCGKMFPLVMLDV
ncbi:DNA polymerase III subunit delta [Sodalis endosymbiont of Henestaris halophilus]|uniref:DNA polymerase III subunit delta n=1 Tax=Sodalis endosymbiont of Henestaris halophilus TaxID=1929246 RepID=UPI000BC033A0|nr:DNA polymerase III subunit delta [Sodalis endosymbiont of Henestaris halophilus]SNC59007.1 DNA polymerase III subunit delta [Sodalis endosymbiont of Henestaris halophilus]